MVPTDVNFSIVALFILVALLIMDISNYIYQRRQAQELRRMADMTEEGVMIDIALKREATAKEVLVDNALAWFKQVVAQSAGMDIDLMNVRQAYPDLKTVDVQASTMRLVVSVHNKAELTKLLKGDKARSKAAKALAKFGEPLLGKSARRVTAFESNLLQDIWFDIKAEQAGQKLGLNWAGQNRLYFYLVPVG